MNKTEMNDAMLEQVDGGAWTEEATDFYLGFWDIDSGHYCPVEGRCLQDDFERLDQKEKVYDIEDLCRLISGQRV